MRDVGLVRRVQPPDPAHRQVEDGVVPGVAVAGEEPPGALHLRQDRPLGLVQLGGGPHQLELLVPGGALRRRGQRGVEVEGFLRGALDEPDVPAPVDPGDAGVPAALSVGSAVRSRLEDVHAAEDVVGGGRVTHVQALEVEVAPRAVGHDPLVPVVVADDLARVVARAARPSRRKYSCATCSSRSGSARSRVNTPQWACWKNPRPGAGAGEVRLAVPDVRRPVAVLDEVLVADAGHPEQPPPHVGEALARVLAIPEGVAMRPEPRRVAHVHQRPDLVALREQRLPTVTGVSEHGQLVLAQGHPEAERRRGGPPCGGGSCACDRPSGRRSRPGGSRRRTSRGRGHRPRQPAPGAPFPRTRRPGLDGAERRLRARPAQLQPLVRRRVGGARPRSRSARTGGSDFRC